MRIFVFKTLFIFVCIFLLFQLTIGSKIREIEGKMHKFKSKEKATENIFHKNEKINYYKELILFYKKEIKNICNVLKLKCNHVLVNDSIDISPDESQTIIYCEKCETTF